MTYHMHGYGKWKSDKPVDDDMLRAMANVINHNKQEHKFQPGVFLTTNDADQAAYAVAALLDLWFLATDVPVRNAATFRDFLNKLAERQGEPSDVLWLPDLGERLYPLLEFPSVYQQKPAGG